MAASSGRKTSSSSKSANKKTAKSTGKGRASAQKRKAELERAARDSALFHEIGLIVLFAAMVFLFCCNFGLIGPAGDAVSGVLFGLFGTMAYAVPVLLFLAAAFWFANEGNPSAVRKLVAGVVLFVMLGILCDLITKGAGSLEEYQALQLYENCRDAKSGGGILAGSISFFLQGYLETIGTVLVVVLGSVVSLILLTEKSLLNSVKRGGSRVRELSREDAERRREMLEIRRQEQEENARIRREQSQQRRQAQEEQRAKRARERRLRAEEKENEKILRMERKVSGVMLDTALTKPGEGSGHQDDVHEIILPEEEFNTEETLTYTAEPVAETTAETMAETTETPEFDFEKIQIRGTHQVNIEGSGEKWQTEDRALEPWNPAGDSVSEEGNPEQESLPGEDFFWDGGEEPPKEELLYTREASADVTRNTCNMPEEAALRDARETSGEESSVRPADWREIPEEESAACPEGRQETPEEESAARPAERQQTPAANGSAKTAGQQEMPGRTDSRPKAVLPREGGQPANAGSSPGQKVPGTTSGGPVSNVPKKYMYPPISLLEKGAAVTGDSARELKETAMRLQQTLNTFGVKVTITHISQGPSVTRYELQPEQGVKVSKIVGLTDDIKLNLAAMDIRIEAPIPGKAAIGIEVPNKENMPVALRDLLETKDFREFPSNIAFGVGKDIAGQVVVADIAKMPHMLIAGATGSGKSVCINTLIMSILYKAHPDDVKLIMIDPKVVELSIYNGIPHLLIPVVTDPKKASAALHWGVTEMDDRYRKFAECGVRNLKEYNKKAEARRSRGEADAPARLPQIVIIVDELADLMMVCPGEVEAHICRLAQLARACGIHLVIATQRPSVDVITGLIKANMPSRVAFSVSSSVDSRTILDMVGAEKLLGKGDMLFFPQGFSKPARVQGAFVSDEEVSAVVDFLKNQVLGNTYTADIEAKIASMESSSGGGEKSSGGSDVDELFEKAGRLIIDKDKASIGMLQRALQIGFNRAARIMDQLCQYGVVGEEEGTKPRKILMSPEQFEHLMEEVA